MTAAPDDAQASLPLARLLGHAADALQAVRAGRSLDAALAACPPEARPGTQALAFHVLRWLGSAQAVRKRLAPKTPPPSIDALLTCALALLWPPGAPPYADHTLVDQAVRAARARGTKGRDGAAFMNGVLRRFVRERDALVAELTAPSADVTARWNHSAWWVERLRADWPAHWQQLLEAANQHPPMTLRANARRGDAASAVARLAAEGIGARAIGSHALILDKPLPVLRIPGFAEGALSVQDAAAQRAAPLLIGAGLPPGARVLDACAAPGGKTAHLLELADLDVLALDRDALRLARVGETLARLDLHAHLLAANAGDPTAWWDGVAFDAILLDAPCSASGIVRRHPDVRWLR
ncbi:MAG: transcription antitermination factor NusB, partial [Burkholderiales bacterium]